MTTRSSTVPAGPESLGHRDLEYGLARMYEIQAAEYANVRLFRTIDAAADWLGVSRGVSPELNRWLDCPV
jgi:hypothetical protein